MANAKVVLLKLLFVMNKKADGTSYQVMKTILADGTWIEVKFGDEVNTKLWKGKHQLITAMDDDVHMPLSFEPYTNKEGKKKYPYIWIDRIVDAKPLATRKSKTATQSMFNTDEVDTEPVNVASIDEIVESLE